MRSHIVCFFIALVSKKILEWDGRGPFVVLQIQAKLCVIWWSNKSCTYFVYWLVTRPSRFEYSGRRFGKCRIDHMVFVFGASTHRGAQWSQNIIEIDNKNVKKRNSLLTGGWYSTKQSRTTCNFTWHLFFLDSMTKQLIKYKPFFEYKHKQVDPPKNMTSQTFNPPFLLLQMPNSMQVSCMLSRSITHPEINI